ncbi:phage holin family protein [Polyangium jinanense]|uniref:Phage holin family protein n=1 Tax=Polyangium jinanense TaxID=2829994 RepID=A0A9X3X1N3_9BACT|nr:phage holin family protein [Polyangium jinanense]MDC3954577.1 phage holin family protein [Polyangium jinanense]MDC3980880.1 phage holin family protein [Polyangium jinanense]
MKQERPSNGNGHALVRGPSRMPPGITERELPPIARPPAGVGMSTGEAIAAVARDTIDVATELVRDGIALGKLEAQRAVSEMVPRVVWGLVAFISGAAAAVLAIIAVMIGLGAIIPSVAGRLAILAGVLFVVAFFGAVRAMRSGRVSETVPISATESPVQEGVHKADLPGVTLPGEPGRSRPMIGP